MPLNLNAIANLKVTDPTSYPKIKKEVEKFFRELKGTPSNNDELRDALARTTLQDDLLLLSIEKRQNLQNLLDYLSAGLQSVMDTIPEEIGDLIRNHKPEEEQLRLMDLANSDSASSLRSNLRLKEVVDKIRTKNIYMSQLSKINIICAYIRERLESSKTLADTIPQSPADTIPESIEKNARIAAIEATIKSLTPSPWHQRHKKLLIGTAALPPLIVITALACVYQDETVRFLNDAGNAIVDTGNDINNAFNNNLGAALGVTFGALAVVAIIAVAIRHHYQKSENNITKAEQTLPAETVDHALEAEAPAASPSPSPSATAET